MAGLGAQYTLNLGLDVVDGVGGLNLQGDGLAGQSLDEDLDREDMSAAAVRWRGGAKEGTHLHACGCVVFLLGVVWLKGAV